MKTLMEILISVISSLIVLITIRAVHLIYKIRTGQRVKAAKNRTSPSKTVICIGSGGHTTEMLLLMENINIVKYTPRYYVMASSDSKSYSKVTKLETEKSANSNKCVGEYYIVQIPRSRSVHQSYLTSIITTLYSIVYSIPFIIATRPDLILCNGPGTCIPICGLAFLLRLTFIKDVRTVYIESFCRVKTLSLTGKIMLYFADNFIVQWPFLKERFQRVEYIGQLM